MRVGEVTYIHSQCFTAVRRLIAVDAHQGFAVLEKTSLQTDDDELHPRGSMVADIVGNPRDVGIVESGINLVEDEER